MAPGPMNGALMKLTLELLQTLHDEGTIKVIIPIRAVSGIFASDGTIGFLGGTGKEICSLKRLN